MWIDTHCHLDAAEFALDRDAVAARALAAGVTQVVIPAVKPADFERVRALAHRHGCAYALGIHPMCVDAATDADLAMVRDALATHRDDPRLVAVGEIGLDHFVPGLDLARQEHFFTHQLGLAREFGLPAILHSRRAVDTLLKHLRRSPVRGIAHAFNGSSQQAAAFVDLGWRLGFGGAMTFDRALRIRELARALPEHAIVLETDAPDIPPHWLYRTAAERAAGEAIGDDSTGAAPTGDASTTNAATRTRSARNESAELPRIAETLASLRGCSLAAVARFTSANARAALPRLQALATAGPGDVD